MLCVLAIWVFLFAQRSTVLAQTTLNVTNFGAIGDAVQFWVNTTSNSAVVTTTNPIPNSAIGDAIEVFQAGMQTYGVNSYGTNAYGNQDLIATITGISQSTNITISTLVSNTLRWTFATYGHDNRVAISNCIAAVGNSTNATITIPAGTYLFLTGTNVTPDIYASLVLTNGGITFTGAGPARTTLLAQGAWTLKTDFNNTDWPTRGELFEENPPMNNAYPVVFENMTLDGGVPQANSSIHGEYANAVDGMGGTPRTTPF